MRLFGSRLKFAVETVKNQLFIIRRARGKHVLGWPLTKDMLKLIFQFVISIILLMGGMYIILYVEDPSTKKAAFGWIGAVIGYWLG